MNLSSQALSGVSNVCSDKTGTITVGKLFVANESPNTQGFKSNLSCFVRTYGFEKGLGASDGRRSERRF
jgi:magnesium-transporting ATPase (P-type)